MSTLAMITFKISFLLAFVNHQSLNKKQLKKSNKKAPKNKVNKIKQNVTDEKPKYLFEIKTTIGTAHIEYELVPTKLKYNVDILCYGSSAKIFTVNAQKNLKTIIVNDKIWVPVCLEHYVESLNLDEIKKFQEYVIEFNIFTNKNKLGPLAKADKTKLLYACNDQASYTNFIEIYNEDPNVRRTSKGEKESVVEKYEKISCKPNIVGNTSSYLYIPKKEDTIYEIIQKDSSGIETICKDFVLPCIKQEATVKIESEIIGKIKNKKDKTSKENSSKNKSKKKENMKEELLKILVPAEIFFTDPQLAIYKAKNANRIVKDIFVILSVNQLLTRSQKLILNSLVIKIKKLSDIPLDVIRDNGISSIYVMYDIPHIASCKSIEKSLNRTINFNESHIYFNVSGSKIKLIEFIQTQKLYMEIYGVRQTLEDSRLEQLFGNNDDLKISRLGDHFNSNAREKKLQSSILLAVCLFDISSLMHNVWEFKEKGQCHSVGLTLFQKCSGFYSNIKYTDVKTVNEVNIYSENFKKNYPLSEEKLLICGTNLQVEVYLMAPQAASLILHQIPNTFKRILFVSFVEEFAKNVLDEIATNNKYIFSEIKNQDEDKKIIEVSDIITGFMVDNGNNFFFFIEGPSTGFILNIWHILDKCTHEQGKIFFNTDSAFEKRLYNDFLNKGIYIISLKVPLKDILGKYKLYLTGSVPEPCMEALKKLSLIFHSSSYKSILQNNLLPKPQELISMDIEWGVPLRWIENKNNLKLNFCSTYSQVILNLENKD